MEAVRRGLLALLAVLPTAALALPPGDHAISFGSRREARSYILHVPQVLGPRPALVLNFHGGGGHGAGQQKASRMDALADKEGFLVAYPEGTGPLDGTLQTWNAGGCCGSAALDDVDDVGYVKRMLFDLSRRQAYDPARVYATGIANGAMMAYRLGAELSDRIAAVAGVAGVIAVEHPPTARRVPVLHIHSVDDRGAPYAGGLGPSLPMARAQILHLSVEAALADWAKADGCTGGPEAREKKAWQGHTATLLAYTGCGAEVLHWKLTGAGHGWPGGEQDTFAKPPVPGTSVIDANEVIWKFFRRNSLLAP